MKIKPNIRFSIKENISLKLPLLLISNKEIKRVSSTKYPGILLYVNLTWKGNIRVIESKTYIKVKRILNADALKCLYFLFVHSYLKYDNTLCGSSAQTKFRKLASKQKQAIRIIGDECYDLRQKILNVHKINIYQVLNFIFKMESKTAPSVFQTNLQRCIIQIQLDLAKIVL